ncbi:MAG TPA: zinc dependent phospholipase C family protein [Acidobacteriaceae bacterium]|nr:zinc dependent phospholipase C family protein [Acidobacteriaceae bacterium]
MSILLVCQPAGAYSLQTHEQLIDLTWQGSIVPLLRSRYPGITPEELERARSYAYAGSVIQDIGYYPFGDAFVSDLTHYVRTGDFIVRLFRDAKDQNQLAFAVGALSHYIGDNIGHSLATNRAVPIEFPKLEAKYGHIVTYGQDEHAHVQTEFAFDINEIAHRRFAPVHYLRHVGLNVPTQQLASAFYETYGVSADFSQAKIRRINVGGFRFAVRNFIPRVAYAVTLLHRGHMPTDTPGPELQKFETEVAQVAAENQWDKYRKKAGIGTYTLAGFIYIVPKIGPLKLVAIKGPTPSTEADYIRSVNLSTEALSAAMERLSKPHQTLANRDLDTGAPVQPGTYRLTDETYAKLLHRLVADPHHTVPPGLKSDILHYYADSDAPIHTKKNPEQWARVQSELQTLRTMPVSDQPIATETE